MKTHQNLLILIAVFCLTLSFSSCKRTSTGEKSEEDKQAAFTEAFEANFIGDYTYVGPDTLPNPKCTDSLSTWRAIVDVKGNSNVLGEITGHLDFCGNEASHYSNMYAYLLDADSDTLFVTGAGQVLGGRLDDHPEFVTSYWKDSFVFIGGTGKFKGATGSCITDDYNTSEDQNSHHHWKGTITLLKGEK